MEDGGSKGVRADESISRRRFLARGGAFALAAAVTGPGLTVLSGCGGAGSASEPLIFWQFYAPAPQQEGSVVAQSRWFEDLISAWNERNETKVEPTYIPTTAYLGGQKLPTAFAAEDGPDIFIVSPGDFLRYYNGGVLQDITPYLSQEAIDDFYPNALSTRTVGDRIYGLPMEVEPLAMFYSVPAFEEAGLSEADIPTTWDGLLDVGARLQSGERAGVVLETAADYYQNFLWYPFMWQGGGEAIAQSGTESNFASEGAIRALAYWQEAVEKGVSPRTLPAAGDVPSAFTQGYAGIWLTGIYDVAALRADAPDLDYGVFRLPVPEGGEYTTDMGGWAFVANAQGRNPEEAARFCAWALGSTDDEGVQRVADWCVEAKTDIAPRRSVLRRATEMGGYDSEVMRAFRDEIFPGGRAEPRYPPVVYKSISDAIQGSMLAGRDPREQAEQAQQAINAYLETYEGAAIV